MPDNVNVTPGSGAVIAADEVTRGGILEKEQVVKIGIGDDGNFDGLVGSTRGMPVEGLGTDGNPHRILTDSAGRTRIIHGQPVPVTATLALVADQIAVPSDGFSDAIFYFGNPPTGSNVITFEQSPDSTTGSDGNWFSTLGFNQSAAAAAAATATITTTALAYRVSAPGASWIRARVSTHTSGSISAQAVTTSAAAQPQVTATLSSAAVTMTSTTIAAPAATIAGLTIGKVLSAASTNATSQKGTAARLQGWSLYNTTAAFKFLKFFNKATAPTVGTDTPVFTVAIPPNGEVSFASVQAISFATGLAYCITGAFADLDTTVVAAGDVIGAMFYV